MDGTSKQSRPGRGERGAESQAFQASSAAGRPYVGIVAYALILGLVIGVMATIHGSKRSALEQEIEDLRRREAHQLAEPKPKSSLSETKGRPEEIKTALSEAKAQRVRADTAELEVKDLKAERDRLTAALVEESRKNHDLLETVAELDEARRRADGGKD